MHANYVHIFDTTLRDGEQSPGASLTSAEKLEIARGLARLGVDVIEAGFPSASPDDLEGVRRIAVEVGNAAPGGESSRQPRNRTTSRSCAPWSATRKRRWRSRPRCRSASRRPRIPACTTPRARARCRCSWAPMKEIRSADVVLRDSSGREVTLPNDVVFVMIGREAPLDFFRRSGIPIRGEWRPKHWASLALFVAFYTSLYNWKLGGGLTRVFEARHWFPFNVPGWLAGLSAAAGDPSTLLGTLAITLKEPRHQDQTLKANAFQGCPRSPWALRCTGRI